MTIERIRIIREIEKTTMSLSRKISNIVLGVLLLHCAMGADEVWHRSQGVAAINCPLDDDPDNPTLLPYYGDCTKFIKCSYGQGYTLSCPLGLHWSKALNRCEFPGVASCNSNESTPKPIVGGNGCAFKYRPHADCDKLIQCINGQELVLDCPQGSYWNRNINSCVFDKSVCQ